MSSTRLSDCGLTPAQAREAKQPATQQPEGGGKRYRARGDQNVVDAVCASAAHRAASSRRRVRINKTEEQVRHVVDCSDGGQAVGDGVPSAACTTAAPRSVRGGAIGEDTVGIVRGEVGAVSAVLEREVLRARVAAGLIPAQADVLQSRRADTELVVVTDRPGGLAE